MSSPKLHDYCSTTLKKDMSNPENVIQLIEGIFETDDHVPNDVSFCTDWTYLLESLGGPSTPSMLEHREDTAVLVRDYGIFDSGDKLCENVDIFLMRSLKTTYSSMVVHYIRHLSQADSDTSVPSLCRLDLTELATALTNWTAGYQVPTKTFTHDATNMST